MTDQPVELELPAETEQAALPAETVRDESDDLTKDDIRWLKAQRKNPTTNNNDQPTIKQIARLEVELPEAVEEIQPPIDRSEKSPPSRRLKKWNKRARQIKIQHSS